ncbi:Arc family DNA-binding protein [Escherichia coli]
MEVYAGEGRSLNSEIVQRLIRSLKS